MSEGEKIKTVLCIDDNFDDTFWGKIKRLFGRLGSEPEKGKTYVVESEDEDFYSLALFDKYNYGKEHFVVISER